MRARPGQEGLINPRAPNTGWPHSSVGMKSVLHRTDRREGYVATLMLQQTIYFIEDDNNISYSRMKGGFPPPPSCPCHAGRGRAVASCLDTVHHNSLLPPTPSPPTLSLRPWLDTAEGEKGSLAQAGRPIHTSVSCLPEVANGLLEAKERSRFET